MLPKPMQEQLNLLYKVDEYGAKFVDLTKKPSAELVQFFEKNYQIKTDRMAMCVGCQIRQIVKYMDKRIDEKSYPTDKFNIRCTGVPAEIGITEEQIKRVATEKGIDLADARRQILATVDPVAWAEMMFGFRESTPQWALRSYQREQLRCNALRAVFRQGRRSGKTFSMALKLLYLCFNLTIDKGFDADGKRMLFGPEIIIVTPFQSQISNIFHEMEELLKRNRSLGNQIAKNNKGNYYTQTPFFSMDFANGANISGFVTGTAHKQDGSAGGTIRGASADVVYLDEMDLIPDEIMKKVIEPLIVTRPGVRMYGTSTPIGKRGAFWRWSQERPDFREFYYPSTSLPAWQEVKREIVGDVTEGNETFRAEYLAEFVDGTYGVFKPSNIHAARSNYTYEQVATEPWWGEMGIRHRSNLITCIGIDWNKTSGSEFVVVGYDPESSNWFALDAVNITAATYTFEAYKEEFLRLNFKWKPDYIYADAGYGHTVIEDLKLIAHRLKGKPHLTNYESETIKVLDRLKAFEFGGKVELRDPVTAQTIVKPGKAFLVETAVRLFEANKFFFPETDSVLAKQLGNYIVVRQSESTGKPIYGPDNEKIGDHRLDAMMLGIGGIFLEQGIYARKLAGSTPAMLAKEDDSLPAFLFNERTDGMVLKNDLMKKNAAAGARLTVLEILRGANRDEDQNVRKGYAAQEYLKNPPKGTRGDIKGPGVAPQAPASAYAKDEEDIWSAQKAWRNRQKSSRGLTRRGTR